MEDFWLDNPKIIIDKYLEFIPREGMTENELYNAITRLCIYVIILTITFNQSKYFIYIGISIITIMIVMSRVKTVKGKIMTTTDDEKEKKVENFKETSSIGYNKNNVDNIDDQFDLNNNPNIVRRNIKTDKLEMINNSKYDKDEVQVGYYDSSNKLRFNRTTGRINEDSDPNVSNLNYACKMPTEDNPFMNPDIDDYEEANENPPVACNADNEDIPEQIDKSFRKDLYLNYDDAYKKKNFERQFYTVPNTSIPNHQTEFAQWLFKSPETCKENQERCLRHEDLRFKR